MRSQYNDDSAAISPHMTYMPATHYRHKTINQASISAASYRPQRSNASKKQSVKLKPFSKAYMQIALEHDQKLRGSKSPINLRNQKQLQPKVIDNRNSLRNSKEIQKEL
jgi:hypothetical protein